MTDVENAAKLEIQKHYSHPIETVFNAWSKASKVKPWWGPAEFTATMFESQFDEGGDWRAEIVGPDGKPMGQSGRYTRIEPNKLIAFTFKWENVDSPETEITVEFVPDGDGTLVTFRQAPFRSEESRRSHREGWSECLARLGEHLRETVR